jgi:hypothetical protein
MTENFDLGIPEVEYLDVSMTDSITRHTTFMDDEGQVKERVVTGPIPEEIMTELNEFNGDGKGKVTVSADLGSSFKFFKAGAFVSIGVTCDSNTESLIKVHSVLQPIVQKLAEEDHAKMSDVRADILKTLTGESSPRLAGTQPTMSAEEGRVTTPIPPRRALPTKATEPVAQPKPGLYRR